MRITTWNVNGLRAAIKKGFAAAIAAVEPDVLLLQEVRALPEQLPAEWANPAGWHVFWNPAERLGYSGTAIWSRTPIKIIGTGLGADDPEGRVVHATTNGIDIVSIYLPSGSSSEIRQGVKERWMTEFTPWAAKLIRKRKPVFVGGDFNIAHTERDIFYAQANSQTSGFMPHERDWVGALLDTGWRDVCRENFGDIDGPYSWWSNRGNARELDRGWRIDYLIANSPAANRVKSAEIYRPGGLTVSDHAPVSIDLDC